MNYYKSKSLAIQDILELLEKKTPKNKLYYLMMVKYGFSDKITDKLINIIKNANK